MQTETLSWHFVFFYMFLYCLRFPAGMHRHLFCQHYVVLYTVSCHVFMVLSWLIMQFQLSPWVRNDGSEIIAMSAGCDHRELHDLSSTPSKNSKTGTHSSTKHVGRVSIHGCVVHDHIAVDMQGRTYLHAWLSVSFSELIGECNLKRGNTKGRWWRRRSRTSLCKNWLRVKVCCVHKFLCAIQLLCKGICVKCKKCLYEKSVVRKTFCA